ncbi:hypothetical protein J5N97_001422 [Dioscorea zingiberensis]|uniref:Uncharacterized protein n=1 Tax=Dioscorea zingiberensis TaxID=325984 RepID=A0A9D5BUC5_9LILI|nr:hypothetical protein J5N97_001422 [Dioscorea zingiberensis]
MWTKLLAFVAKPLAKHERVTEGDPCTQLQPFSGGTGDDPGRSFIIPVPVLLDVSLTERGLAGVAIHPGPARAQVRRARALLDTPPAQLRQSSLRRLTRPNQPLSRKHLSARLPGR